MKLKELLRDYEPWDIQEQKDKEEILLCLETYADLYTRNNACVHITVSPWIVNADNSKVLMVHHNIYRSWGWCGGHADGDTDLLHEALREAYEETGIQNLQPYGSDILSVDILPVKEHMRKGKLVKAHKHINITFLCIGDEQQSLRTCPKENSGVLWIAKEDIDTCVTEDAMRPLYRKLIEKSDRILRRSSR